MKNSKKIILWSIFIVILAFSYILWNSIYFIDNYLLLTKIFFILIRYIILPIQAFLLFHIFNKNYKENIITTSSLVILRIILQYTLEPITQINEITSFIFEENILEYQPVVSYIITLIIIGGFYITIRKSIDYLSKK